MSNLTPDLLQSFLDSQKGQPASDAFQLSNQEMQWLEYLDWISTHPQTKARGLSIENFVQKEGVLPWVKDA